MEYLHLSQSLQLRDVPGRQTPSVPQPSSGTLTRASRVSLPTPFHSTTSTGFFSLEDVSSASEVSGLEDMTALKESNKAVMERLQRNEQPTPVTECEEKASDRPLPSETPLSAGSENGMTETRQDLLQGDLTSVHLKRGRRILVFCRNKSDGRQYPDPEG